jgi:hypothetical protein
MTVDSIKRDGNVCILNCKDVRTLKFVFDSNDDSSLWFYNYLKPLLEVQNFEDLFAFNYKPFKVETNGWDVWNPVEVSLNSFLWLQKCSFIINTLNLTDNSI